MNIAALTSAATGSLSALSPTSSSSTYSAVDAPFIGPGTGFPLVTENDVAIFERLSGKTSIAALEEGPDLGNLQWLQAARQRGDVTGSLEKYIPAASLIASDAALLETMTGTTNLNDATSSSSDASNLMFQISAEREHGSWTGDITVDDLKSVLAAAQQAEDTGSYGHTVSSTFLEKAIATLEHTNSSSSSVLA